MISRFRGEYSWLSNFYLTPVTYEGVIYKSVEHAYMSAKSDIPSWKIFCMNEENPGKVKKESKKITLVKNWDEIKYDVMKKCLFSKFRKNPLRQKLLDTGDQQIIEGNTWGDTYWGYDINMQMGKNNLGKLIMKIRKKLQEADLSAKEYLEKRYQEDKKMWSAMPVDPEWKKWVVKVMDDYAKLKLL